MGDINCILWVANREDLCMVNITQSSFLDIDCLMQYSLFKMAPQIVFVSVLPSCLIVPKLFWLFTIHLNTERDLGTDYQQKLMTKMERINC